MLPEGKLPRSVCLWGADQKSDQLPRACIAVRDLRWTVEKLMEWAKPFFISMAAILITSANRVTSTKVKFRSCLDFRVAHKLKMMAIALNSGLPLKKVGDGNRAGPGTSKCRPKRSATGQKSVLVPDIFSSRGIGHLDQNCPFPRNERKINPPNGKNSPQEGNSHADKGKVGFWRGRLTARRHILHRSRAYA